MSEIPEPEPREGRRAFASEARLTRGFRVDLLIGVCALLVSSLATAASLWQSHLISQQLASQVWPFVSIGTSYDPKPGRLTLTVSNEGLGPAQIRSIVVTVDGTVERTLDAMLKTLAPTKTLTYTGSLATIGVGQVIRVGGSVTIVDISGRDTTSTLARGFKRIRVRVCYCAIIPGNCWMIQRGGSGTDVADPTAIGACPDEARDTFVAGAPPA